MLRRALVASGPKRSKLLFNLRQGDQARVGQLPPDDQLPL